MCTIALLFVAGLSTAVTENSG